MFETDQKLLNQFQRDFPLVPRPYAAIGKKLGISEGEVIEDLARLSEQGAISRIGAVVRPGAVGASTLAAMKVPADRMDEVAALVSGFEEVNHNYEREHHYSLWFVLTAPSEARLEEVLAEIANQSGIEPISLPMEQDYHLDLGFQLQWTKS